MTKPNKYKLSKHAIRRSDERNLIREVMTFVAEYGYDSPYKPNAKIISKNQLLSMAIQNEDAYRQYLRSWREVVSTTCIVINNTIVTGYKG